MGWSQDANRRKSLLKKEFAEGLNGIAECLSVHDNAASVAETHVDQAFLALARAGLLRRRWIDKPDSIQSLGAFFVGFAFACPDAVTVLVPAEKAGTVAAGLFIGSFLFGAFLWAFGVLSSKLPVLPPRKWSREWWTRRIAMTIIIALAVAAAGYMLKSRLQDCCLPPEVPTPANETALDSGLAE